VREPYRRAHRVQRIRQRTGSAALPSVARNFPVAQELIRAGLVFRVESSAVNTAGAVAGLHGRSPLLRLQSDERLIALIRRGNQHAFEALVARYQSRLLAFCRHMLSSKEDAEDVLQEVFAAAFNAILADEREINVRPWLYRIARNRSLNHLRRATAVGVDSMDVHLSDGGQTTADKVHKREEFRLLIADVQDLPETQRTALLLREIDALSYEQIAEAMETTVPSVKSLLVRARASLMEASEARLGGRKRADELTRHGA
jgi:RNA polymerase sigma factor (sigma-70 family)